jgi:hypothetical protein
VFINAPINNTKKRNKSLHYWTSYQSHDKLHIFSAAGEGVTWFHYHKGYIILKLWYTVLKVSVILTHLFSSISKNKWRSTMEKVCKLSCQSDYFKTSVWGKIDSSKKVYILFEDLGWKLWWKDYNLSYYSLHFKALYANLIWCEVAQGNSNSCTLKVKFKNFQWLLHQQNCYLIQRSDG